MHRRVVGWGLVLALAAPALRAERLPLKLYTAADGLAGDAIQALAEDPRGFLWVGTTTGLSRFDGVGFTTYGVRDGLPHPAANTVLVSSDGTVWVGTPEGLSHSSRAPRAGGPMFETLRMGDPLANRVQALAEVKAGRLWVGTLGGLFTVDPLARGLEVRREPLGYGGYLEIYSLEVEGDGRLWVGTSRGLAERFPDGRVRWHHLWPDADGFDPIKALARDRAGTLWVAHSRAVFAARPPAGGWSWEGSWVEEARARARSAGLEGRLAWRAPVSAGGLGLLPLAAPEEGSSGGIALGGEGTVWVSTSLGVLSLHAEGWRLLSGDHGLPPDRSFTALLRDRGGNLWIGTEARGLACLSPRGLISYGPPDGLEGLRIGNVFEDRSGELLVRSSRLYLFSGERFEDVTPPALLRLGKPGWGWHQTVLQDRQGEWWFPSGEGLLRFPAVAARELKTAVPLHHYTRRDGLPGLDVFRLYEDRRGDLWLSLLDGDHRLVRYRREADRFESIPPFPSSLVGAPSAFEEDEAGNLWLGFYLGGLARWNEREGALAFPPGAEVPAGFVYDLLRDRGGSIWAAMSNGVVRIDDPTGPAPRLTRLDVAGGLAGDSLRALAEDHLGRLYLGSDRGIDRLDPKTGALESFTTGDGLANSRVSVLFADRHRRIWAGTLLGLSRLDPDPAHPAAPVPVVVVGVSVAGVPQIVPALPESRLTGFELPPGGNRIQIDFVGVSLASGPSLRYQTRLAGLAPEWSSPSTSKSVLLAGLPAGRHLFQVRAVAAAGEASGALAEVAFVVLPPFWRQVWFLAATAALLAVTAWSAFRYRVGRLLAVERARTRIASDLHDDVGASLSRIGILAEVGKLRLGSEGVAEAQNLLSEIGDISRGLSEVMSDIVWALDPRRDDLRSLVSRLRRFASDMLEAQGVRLDFQAPPAGAAQRLGTGDRRELYLLLKEAIHNAARHSRASAVAVSLEVRGNVLHAEVKDDGVGLPPVLSGTVSGEISGHGLASMRRRAGRLRGRLVIESAPGSGTAGGTAGGGTRVRLEAPLARWRGLRGRRRA